MERKTIEKGSLENPELKKDIPPSAGFLEMLAVESAAYLISQPDNKLTHGNIVTAIQHTFGEHGINESERTKYYDLIQSRVSSLAKDPEKLKVAKSTPQYQHDLSPDVATGEVLKFEPAPGGGLKVHYQGHEHFATLSMRKGKNVVVIKRGKNSISLTNEQYNFLRHEAHKRFAEIEKRRQGKFNPNQKDLF